MIRNPDQLRRLVWCLGTLFFQPLSWRLNTLITRSSGSPTHLERKKVGSQHLFWDPWSVPINNAAVAALDCLNDTLSPPAWWQPYYELSSASFFFQRHAAAFASSMRPWPLRDPLHYHHYLGSNAVVAVFHLFPPPDDDPKHPEVVCYTICPFLFLVPPCRSRHPAFSGARHITHLSLPSDEPSCSHCSQLSPCYFVCVILTLL